MAGLACLGWFYDPDITTHGEVWECFLTPDGRGQLVAAGGGGGAATDDKIHSTSPTHTQLCHWLEWSLGHFSVHSSPSIRDALSVVHFFFSVSNALSSDLEILQQFLLQELKVLQVRFLATN